MQLLLLLSRFSRVQLCATPETAAHQAPPSLGFSRQEHWSGLPFPSPVHESEKWKWSHSVVSNSSWPHGLQPTRLLRPCDFPGKSTGVGCHCLLWRSAEIASNTHGDLVCDKVGIPSQQGKEGLFDKRAYENLASWWVISYFAHQELQVGQRF